MRSKWIAWVLGCWAATACSSEPPTGPDAGRALIDEAAAAMGGWEALSSIERQELITQGNDWEPLQATEPGQERRINGFGRRIQIDFTAPAMRLEFDAERSYPAPAPVRFIEVIAADAGAVFTPGAEGEMTAVRMHGARYAARMRDLHRLPHRLLLLARDAQDLTRTADRVLDGETFEALEFTDGGNQVEVLLSSFNKLPMRVIYHETDPLQGDVENEVRYVDWRQSQVSATDEGVPVNARLPFGQIFLIDGERIREEAFRNIINNGRFEDPSFEIPAEVLQAPEPGERVVTQWLLRRAVMGLGDGGYLTPQSAVLTEVAPGVLHVTGTSHHSMVVEMADHLVVVEAPLFEERSLAVIEALEERFPTKPIRHVVVTHFHVDHSGGIRAYAAKGATIVAHENIVDFLNDALSRPSTIRPDSLAAAGVTPSVEGVAEMTELTDGQRTVQVRHVPNEHATGMVMAYLPAERIAFVSDLYSPPAPIDPANANALAFVSAITEAGLDVAQVVGGHGGVGPLPAP